MVSCLALRRYDRLFPLRVTKGREILRDLHVLECANLLT
jgi:hypothetical protein